MKREGVIISSFLIERQKQVKLFQVRIPREAENIVGVEMGLLWLEGLLPVPPPSPVWSLPMSVQRNLVLGELKLQSYEKANMFYSADLCMNNNVNFADFSTGSFPAKEYSHGYAWHEDPVMVNGNTTLLQGVYRDKLSDYQSSTYRYIVKVYVWIAAKEDQSNI